MQKFIEINGTNIQCEKEVLLSDITVVGKQNLYKHVDSICKKQLDR